MSGVSIVYFYKPHILHGVRNAFENTALNLDAWPTYLTCDVDLKADLLEVPHKDCYRVGR